MPSIFGKIAYLGSGFLCAFYCYFITVQFSNFWNQMTQVIPIFALNLILKVHTYTGKCLIIGIASLKISCRFQNRNGRRGLKEEYGKKENIGIISRTA